MQDDPLPQRTACGFVLVRTRGGQQEYLLLRNRERGEWGLPKGHAEPGESELQTARRETKEETGLTDLKRLRLFRTELRYPASRAGVRYLKAAVYFIARLRSGEVALSEEHDAVLWARLPEALEQMPHENLKATLRAAGLFLKDPALFALEPATEAEALAHLTSLPEASEHLVAHLQGGARLARAFAEALAAAGKPVHIEATAVGTLLHDVGRALGDHADHQRAGLKHLRETPLAAYGFACISHFAKGARPSELIEAGVDEEVVTDFRRLIDMGRLTWEERCAALADACMKGSEAVPPAERFADLRVRYDAEALIALQARQIEGIRHKLEKALGADPLGLVGLA